MITVESVKKMKDMYRYFDEVFKNKILMSENEGKNICREFMMRPGVGKIIKYTYQGSLEGFKKEFDLFVKKASYGKETLVFVYANEELFEEQLNALCDVSTYVWLKLNDYIDSFHKNIDIVDESGRDDIRVDIFMSYSDEPDVRAFLQIWFDEEIYIDSLENKRLSKFVSSLEPMNIVDKTIIFKSNRRYFAQKKNIKFLEKHLSRILGKDYNVEIKHLKNIKKKLSKKDENEIDKAIVKYSNEMKMGVAGSLETNDEEESFYKFKDTIYIDHIVRNSINEEEVINKPKSCNHAEIDFCVNGNTVDVSIMDKSKREIIMPILSLTKKHEISFNGIISADFRINVIATAIFDKAVGVDSEKNIARKCPSGYYAKKLKTLLYIE